MAESQQNKMADLKQRLANLTANEITSLQNTHLYMVRTNWLRTNGWVNIVLGLLTIWLGALPAPSSYQALKTVQIIIGIALALHSFMTIIQPDNPAIFRFVVLFLAAGIWNIALIFFAYASLPLGVLGFFQLQWAYQFRTAYTRYTRLNIVKPSDADANLYQDTWKTFMKTDLKKDADVIRIWVGTGFGVWSGLLAGDYVFLGYRRPRLLLVQHLSEFTFATNSSRAFLKKRVYGRLKIGMPFDISDRAMMKGSYYHKYAHWKGETEPTEIAPTWFQRLPAVIRLIIMGIVGLVAAYIIFIIIAMIDVIIRYS